MSWQREIRNVYLSSESIFIHVAFGTQYLPIYLYSYFLLIHCTNRVNSLNSIFRLSNDWFICNVQRHIRKRKHWIFLFKTSSLEIFGQSFRTKIASAAVFAPLERCMTAKGYFYGNKLFWRTKCWFIEVHMYGRQAGANPTITSYSMARFLIKKFSDLKTL
jgi:hypothetical protein